MRGIMVYGIRESNSSFCEQYDWLQLSFCEFGIFIFVSVGKREDLSLKFDDKSPCDSRNYRFWLRKNKW